MSVSKKILVVDDEEGFCVHLKGALEKKGFSVDYVCNPSRINALLDYNKYDCIFFDCSMPELTGIELIKILKIKCPQAKKIMITGYGLVDKEFMQKLGADDFLEKPIELEQLFKIIQ